MAEHRLAFLLANWFSGATVFNLLLNNHSQVVSNGETFPFRPTDRTKSTCSCGRPLDTCDFYRTAAVHMLDERHGGWNRGLFVRLPEYSTKRVINRWLQSYRHASWLRDVALSVIPSYRRPHETFVAAQEEFFLKALCTKGATLYVDGTKSFRRAEIFAAKADGIIYLLRDGRGFCNSYRKHHRLPSHELKLAAHEWLAHLAAIKEYAHRHPQLPIHILRYEDLCRDLEGTMRKVCAFLDLPFETRVLGRRLETHHLLGNRLRMTFDGQIREDLSWQTEMTEQEIRLITEVMKPDLERYGYLWSSVPGDVAVAR